MLTGVLWGIKSFFTPMEAMTGGISSLAINIPVTVRVIFGFFGIYLFLKKERKPDIRRFLAPVIIFIFISLALFTDILPNLFAGWSRVPLVGSLQTNRFLIYVQAGMYIFAAYGVSGFLAYFRSSAVCSPSNLGIKVVPAT